MAPTYVDAQRDYQAAKASTQPQEPTTAQKIGQYAGYANDAHTAYSGASQAYDAYNGASGASGVPYLNIATGGYGAYKGATGKNMSQDQRATAAYDAARSTVGNIYTFGLSGLAEKYFPKQTAALTKYDPGNFIVSHTFGDHGFDESRRARNAVRGSWQNGGLIDDKYNLTLADGSKYDVGQDGGARLKNTDGTDRPTYNTDFSNPYTGQAIAWANPIAQVMTGGNRKLSSDTTSELVNAFTSNAHSLDDVKANVAAFYAKAGISPDEIKAHLTDISQNTKNIRPDELQAYIGGVDQLMNPDFHGVEIHNHLDKNGNAVPDAAPIPAANVDPGMLLKPGAIGQGRNPSTWNIPQSIPQGPQILNIPQKAYDPTVWNKLGALPLSQAKK